MRNLGPIVGILLGIVGDTRQDRSTGSSIALQLVGDDPEWLLAFTSSQRIVASALLNRACSTGPFRSGMSRG